MSLISANAAGLYKQVAGLDTPKNTQNVASTGQTPSMQGSDFLDMVKDAVASTRDAAKASEIKSMQGIAGTAPVHEVVNSINQAEMAVNTMVAVRDKVITAYQDIIKMPI